MAFCANPNCGHGAMLHAGGRGKCSVAGCKCAGFRRQSEPWVRELEKALRRVGAVGATEALIFRLVVAIPPAGRIRAIREAVDAVTGPLAVHGKVVAVDGPGPEETR
jgi:hypothetical protein